MSSIWKDEGTENRGYYASAFCAYFVSGQVFIGAVALEKERLTIDIRKNKTRRLPEKT